MSAVPLPAVPTHESATAKLIPALLDGGGDYLDLFLDASTWPERMAVVESWFRPVVQHNANTDHTVTQLTAALEQLAERDVTSVEQAILYRISVHAVWRNAAMRFLEGVPDPLAWTGEYPAVAAVVLARMAAEAAQRRNLH